MCNCETPFVLMKDYDVCVDEGEVFAQRAAKGHWWEDRRDDGNRDIQRGCMVNSRSWAEELRDAVASQAETSHSGQKTRLSSTSVSSCLILDTNAHKAGGARLPLLYSAWWKMWCWWLRLSNQSLLRSDVCVCASICAFLHMWARAPLTYLLRLIRHECVMWNRFLLEAKQTQNPMWFTALPGAKRWWDHDKCFSEHSTTVHVWEVITFVAQPFGSSCRFLLYVFHCIKRRDKGGKTRVI